MIENLRLDNTAEHNSDGALAQGYGTSSTYGNFSGLANPESTGFSTTYTANSLYYSGNQEGTASIDIGTTNRPANRMPRYNNWNTPTAATDRPSNPTTNSATNSASNAGMYSYGNYYTWHAAIADTAHSSSGDHDATSLCPKGWRLPIGIPTTSNMSFGKLSVELGGPANGDTANSSSTPTGAEMSKVFRSYPNNFLFSGLFTVSSTTNRGSGGSYWSSTADVNTYSYYLALTSTIVYPGTSNNSKYSGLTIRCIANF